MITQIPTFEELSSSSERDVNHKQHGPYANRTFTISEVTYPWLPTFQQLIFSCQQWGTPDVGTDLPVLKNQGLQVCQTKISCVMDYYSFLSELPKNPGDYPKKLCARQKWEGEREEDATRIGVQSPQILWSWTFSCHVRYTDTNSCSESNRTLRSWNSAPHILDFLS